MQRLLFGAALALAINGAWAQEMKVEFVDAAWDGQKIPAAHNCDAPSAATPALKITNLPATSDYVILAIRDLDGPYQMASDGGHGKLGFSVAAGSSEVVLDAVPQGKKKSQMPAGVELLAEHKGRRPVDGYLAPCSQGQNHRYEMTVRAVTAADKGTVLAEKVVPLGVW